ncbi:VOC family protein [Acidothermaceae bacterium B102]|nr:VOC family protein [Acidothermaceae bacterium B102]
MPKIVNCLWFDGQAEEAAQLYTSIFPDSKVEQVSRYLADMPMPEGTVLTVDFTLDGTPFCAINAGPEYTFSEAISFQIMCHDQAEVDHYWNALTGDGGEEGPCGWLKDRFGMSWQVVPIRLTELLTGSDPGVAYRAGQSFMQMKKLDIAEIERAAAAG